MFTDNPKFNVTQVLFLVVVACLVAGPLPWALVGIAAFIARDVLLMQITRPSRSEPESEGAE